ncbi:hypothetical protein [Paenibacillus sp. BK033]|uniref:hypothetical protein n=1 Tax=Paenibacillus sp. BK033 TaxID=2512133 RepID=UPI001A9EC46A|nr:hypothetical protein [Paenibacillus sp. BK033]
MFKSKSHQSQDKRQSTSDRETPRGSRRAWSKKYAIAATLALSMVFAGVIPSNNAYALTKLTSAGGIDWEIHDA